MKYLDKLNASLDEEFDNNVPMWIEKSLNNIPEEWHQILFSKKMRPKLIKVFNRIQKMVQDPDKDLSPSDGKIFEFAKLTPLNRIHTVIIGQDPYPNPDHAHGLAFSSLNTKIPHSLKNIYNCLIKHKLIDEIPDSGDLTIWARRGVCLLNTSLTTLAGKIKQHDKIWEDYTNELIKKLCDVFEKNDIQLIFILWGNDAQKRSKLIVDDTEHVVLKWRHPSPLANASCSENEKFINCTNFNEVNEILKDERGLSMDWSFNIKKIVAYTDGSALPNKDIPKAKNGYSVIFTEGVLKCLILYGSSPEYIIHPKTKKKMCSTAVRAEGTAILKALEKCNNLNPLKWDVIEIITDCQHWYNMITTFMPKWERDDIDFNDQKVPDITIPLWKEWKELKTKGEIQIRHIPSHGKDGLKKAEDGTQEAEDYMYNSLADELANDARKNLEYDEYKEKKDGIIIDE